MLVKFICWLLKNKSLSTRDRQLLTNQVLTSIGALPTHAILTKDGNQLLIRNVPVDSEKAFVLREAAYAAMNNPAFIAIHEEVLYQAVSLGVHQANTPEMIQFAKAAIWYGEQQKRLLTELSSIGA